MMRIGSLFSGIGGLELGLERSGLGSVAWQVEKDPFCNAVLAKHWPRVERFDDVCAVGKHNLKPVDLICGGFPCQDVSSAGKGAGLAGERSGLWREYARIVSELRPRWVVVENVASGAKRWLDAVIREMEQQAYACLPVPLSAFDVGAPHLRRRIFVIAADAQQQQLRIQPGRSSGENQTGKTIASDNGETAFNADADAEGEPLRPGLEGSRPEAHEGRSGFAANPWRALEPEFLRVADGLSRGMDGPRSRIAALGNSVVPQCAEVVGWIVRELEASR